MRQLWTRAAVIALTAGTLAACESTGGPQYPARDGQPGGSAPRAQTPNFPITQAPAAEPLDTRPSAPEVIRREPIPVEPAPPTYSEPPVTRAELPPPPPPPPAQIRPAAPIIVTTVAGPVVDVPGKPQMRIVESGDALDAIARGFGTTRAELVKLNDLEKPYRLKLGQKIVGPAGPKSKAYVVQSGDTMFAIAKRFSVTAAALAEENDLKAGAAIKKGQKLLLPDGFKDKGPTKTAVAAPPSSTPVTTLAGASTPPAVRPAETSRPATTTPAAPPPVSTPAASPSVTPASVTTTTTTTSVTGAVVTVAGPRQVYTVKSGDTLTAIARRFDMSVSDLAEANDLNPDKALKLGAKVKGPATTAKAYVAQTGDTLTAIAKRFNVTPKALAAENDLKVTATLKKGQKIVLPDGYKDKGPIKTTTTSTRPAAGSTVAQAPTTGESTVTTPSAPIPYRPGPATPRPSAPVAALPVNPPPSLPARPIIESSAAPTEAEIIASGKGKFSWPLRGEIISDFGVKGTGQRNDGLNIRANAGAPVVASADGEIAYAGNQVPTFGNLVLVKHADGWVTAYAHLGSTDVKMRQQVVKGQQLGTVGSTGGVNEPQLHFEMRYAPTVKDKARPVDPALLLPR
ncbi:LysM peptidoglycan-binding domain-containing protein [Caulobacter henricii]|uniref:Peptidase M24 n=1 Tax=Caulobacter henricii TaxID=69395 RepID=A0A0P0P0Z9_9CAUL|nr:LysM peptidoglycan-binding domain-containing protein [Caulobacter henricii]ALL13870.1 peptidase M24 [Caulobacter henricii]